MIYLLIVISCLVVDQCLKKKARETFWKSPEEHGFIKFSFIKNKGAFKGLFKNNPILLKGMQIGATLVVTMLLIFGIMNGRNKLYKLGLSLMLGGSLGNLTDRFTKGYVTDFFAVKWTKNLYYNLADMFVFLGAILSVIGEIKKS